MPNDRNT